MTRKTFDISELQSIRDILLSLTPDSELILTDGITPIARVLPMTKSSLSISERHPDLQSGIWLSSDFDELLPDIYWRTREI